MPAALLRPAPGSVADFYTPYIAAVPDGNVLDRLMEQAHATQALLRGLSNEQALHCYERGKWSVKEVLGHLTDAERVFTYRAMCFARGEEAALPGFDHDAYVARAGFNRRSVTSLLEEYASVRASTLRFYESLTDEEAARVGVANGNRVSAGALAWITAGHERSHQRSLREKYFC